MKKVILVCLIIASNALLTSCTAETENTKDAANQTQQAANDSDFGGNNGLVSHVPPKP